jgi:GTP cyclohydrolase II
VIETTTARLPTAAGEFQLHLFGADDGARHHLALVHGNVAGVGGLLVRVHSECFTGEALGSLRCDCGPQLTDALRQIAAEGCGAVVYLRQEGRGIGLREKLRAYNLQDAGHDTVDANLMLGHPADDRDYAAAADILRQLGVLSVRLLTNNPAKIEGLRGHGIAVTERVPTLLHRNAENAPYLLAKARRMRHLLDLGLGDDGGSPVAAQRQPEPPAGLGSLRRRLERHHATGTRWPFVTLSYAQSVDGCIAATADRPLALSGEASLALTHDLRALHGAILVGVGTVIADDPRLTVRLVAGAQPRPVVLDSRLRTPPTARLLRCGVTPLIATTAAADRRSQRRLEAAGAEVVRLPADGEGRVSVPAALERLGAAGVGSVMVEGGARVITSFLGSRVIDHLVLTVAPLLVGGLRGVHDLGSGFPRLANLAYQPLGEDLVVWGDPIWETA